MNLKTFLISLGLVGIFNLANAQDDNQTVGRRYQRQGRNRAQQKEESLSSNPTGYVAVSSGFANVMGNWGFGVTPQYAGNYALNGSFQSISASIPVNGSNFGVAVMLGLYDNPFDAYNFVSNVEYADPNLNRGYGLLEGGDYTAINFMAGLSYTYPVKRFSFDFRVMAGYISCSLPEIQYGAEEDATPYNIEDTWDISSSTGKGFAYDFGIGIRYTFRRTMCLMLTADILNASLPFSTTQTQQHIDQNGNISYYESSLSGTVPLSLFNIGLGIGIQFGR